MCMPLHFWEGRRRVMRSWKRSNSLTLDMKMWRLPNMDSGLWSAFLVET